MKKSTVLILGLSAVAVAAVLVLGTQPARIGEVCLVADLVYETTDGVVHIEENSAACSPANQGIAPVGEVAVFEPAPEPTYTMEPAF